MTETEFENAVVLFAQSHGWRVFGTARTGSATRTPIRHNGKGFPDCVMAHEERGCIVFVEFKMPGKHPTVEQQTWLRALTAAQPPAGTRYTCRTFLWRPDDTAEIADVLSFGTDPDWSP